MADAPAVRTTCPYCGVGCGILAALGPDGAVEIKGDPEHPANFGRLCSKGSALAETLSHDGRLLHPIVDGAVTSWTAALDRVAARFAAVVREHGPDSVAFYISGQCLTEDYYVANKLMKGFIGSANIDTNSRLCMASSVAGHKRAFGTDTVPGVYTDLDETDLAVLVGSNMAWCHPILFQRLLAAREKRGTKIVVIDPRRTATAAQADLHLPIAPDADVALFNALFAHLAKSSAADRKFVALHTGGLEAALAAAGDSDAGSVAAATGLSVADVERFLALFTRTKRTLTLYSQGVNQSASGTDKVNAIINCHLVTGRIGRPGMGPFSLTGQPNAMGGREVGGLANQLAAHLDVEDPDHRALVAKFWRTRRLATRSGLKAVELFDAVDDGRIKALWIMATNPADSLPDADRVQAALIKCPFVVVSDVIADTDTARFADVLLPSAAWGEKSGTVTNSERRISRQRTFLIAPGEARPDWWQIAEVARRMGFGDAFSYRSERDIFVEHARLSALANCSERDFDIGGLADLDLAAYDALQPVQWPLPAGEMPRERRFFANGRFFTPDRKARFVATPTGRAREPAGLTLNTGRARDHWHTLTRTGRSPRLSAHTAEPFAEIHPADAEHLGIAPAHLVELRNAGKRIVVRARITDEQRRGSVFVPMHWNDQFASSARVGTLVAPETDPISGQPASKFSRVELHPFDASWYGFAAVALRPAEIAADYWAIARTEGGWRLEVAGRMPPDLRELAAQLFSCDPKTAELLSYEDRHTGQHRVAAFDGDRLRGVLFVAPEPVNVARAFAASCLAQTYADAAARLRILAGRRASDTEDPGAIVCSCFQVGFNTIAGAVRSGHCTSVAEVGEVLAAGTNCGSCRAEIMRIVDDERLKKAG